MITEKPFIKSSCITIKELRQIIANLPDTDKYGDDYEVWIGTSDTTSSGARAIWALNRDGEGCDMLIEPEY